MDDFKDSTTAVVADVDCTAEGESLCSEVGVSGYPTIKWGSPSDMQDYQGGRTYEDLKAFADENLGPSCGPANLDLCDAEKKAMIEKLLKMPAADLDAQIQEKTDAKEKLEEEFKTFVEGLQKEYEAGSTKKEEDIKKIKDMGLATLKQVHAHLSKKEL